MPRDNIRNRPSCIIGLEVAGGFPKPHKAFYHPYSSPTFKFTASRYLLPWTEFWRGAIPSYRGGLGVPEISYKTLQGWLPFTDWRLQGNPFEVPTWGKIIIVHYTEFPPGSQATFWRTGWVPAALPVKTSVRPRFWEKDPDFSQAGRWPKGGWRNSKLLGVARGRTGMHGSTTTSNLALRDWDERGLGNKKWYIQFSLEEPDICLEKRFQDRRHLSGEQIQSQGSKPSLG